MIKKQKVRQSVANVNGIYMEKFFLNLEKQKALNTKVRHLIDDLNEINACICKFYKNLPEKNVSKSDLERESLLNNIVLPNLNSKSFDIF